MADRRIVPVKGSRVREQSVRECNKAMARLEEARAELRRFEQEDMPSFGRWLAATFGAMLTELRENGRLIQEHEILITDVEMEMAWSGHHNPRRAYAAVMKQRENSAGNDGPPEEDLEDEEDFEAFEDAAAGIPAEERREMFDDFVRSVGGIDPKQMGRAMYEQMYAQFEEEVFGEREQASGSRRGEEKKSVPVREEARLKQVYRILVRRLHPDLQADRDTAVAAIWHDVQEAYEAGNLNRLETLLALTEIECGTNGGQATVSQIRDALAELKRALAVIQRSIGAAKRDPAWGFSRNPYRGQIEKRIRREMEEDLAGQRELLEHLKGTIDDWSRPWQPPVRKPGKKAGVGRKSSAGQSAGEAQAPREVQAELFPF